MIVAASSSPEYGSESTVRKIAAAIAIGSALTCLVLLGLRTLISVDLGYHLAYGEHTLETGEFVDHNAFLYTLPPIELEPSLRPEPGPASWYDEDGRYRFPNSNWLSQALMAAVFRWGGSTGLSLLAAALTMGISALLLGTLRRMRIPWPLSALGLLLFGLVSFSRLNLRPEMFGYLILAAQLFLLAPIACDVRRASSVSLRVLAAVAALQILFVNLHSYFLLSLAISGAIALDCGIRWIREAGMRRDPRAAAVLQKAGLRLSLLLAAMTLGSLANPWTWRVAILPIETLLYLRANDIGGVAGSHPWSHIGEFRETVHAFFPAGAADYGIIALLVLAGAGGVVALLRRQWGLLLVIGGMSAVSLSMRRNIAPAALVIIPVALAALNPLMMAIANRLTLRDRTPLMIAVAGGIAAVSAFFAFAIVTNRFYYEEERPIRFGIGMSRVGLPIGAADWLDEHLPDARVWTDMASSSTIHFFTRPHRDVPIISNTWAYPPAVMRKVRRLRATRHTVDRLLYEYNADVVVLQYTGSLPLFRALSARPEWRLVHVEGGHVVFARAAGEQAEVVRRAAANLGMPDAAAYVAQQRSLDPSLGATLVQIGRVFVQNRLDDLAVETYSAIVKERPDWVRGWQGLGAALMLRGTRLRAEQDPASRADYLWAEQCFRTILELDANSEAAGQQLDKLSQILVDER
jgi:hypothetical protein